VALRGYFCLSPPHSGTHTSRQAVFFLILGVPLSPPRITTARRWGHRSGPPTPAAEAPTGGQQRASTYPLRSPGRQQPRRNHSAPAAVQNRKKSAPAMGGGAPRRPVVPAGRPPPRTSCAGGRPRRPHPRWRSVGHRRGCARGHPRQPLVAGAGAAPRRRAAAHVGGDSAAAKRKPRLCRRRGRGSRRQRVGVGPQTKALIRRRSRVSWSRPS